ncbi:MAG: MFS transporter [Enhydrobacter sp.]|nr:MAG: MFS transporter [Enhydrobacter sp.]
MLGVESRYAWWRLAASAVLGTLGGVGMWSISVVLPAVEVEFGATRADVSLSYTTTMLGFGVGTMLVGRLIDTRGAFVTVLLASLLLVVGYVAAALSTSLWLFAAMQGALIGVGAAASFIPLVADISHWFDKRRGLAMAICASGNYLAGTLWPKVIDVIMREHDWRTAYLAVAVICLVGMVPCCVVLRPRAPVHAGGGGPPPAPYSARSLGLSPNGLQIWLAIAGVGCCVAMALPQAHIVAYCADLGYGTARGAELLSLMTAGGIVSRVASGWLADRLGGIRTLLLGSTLQAIALLAYLVSDTLLALYLVSALFGLVQGGIIPSYGVIVREYFPPQEAGARMGIAVSATIVGMALGGWMGGALVDLTGSYRASFVNAFAWNVLNGVMIWMLLFRQMRRRVFV